MPVNHPASRLLQHGFSGDGACVFPILESMLFNVNEKPFTYPRHQHPHYEVICVDKGHYRCTVNGQELELRSGDILAVKPGDWHQDFCVPGLGYYSIRFMVLMGFGSRTESVNIFKVDAPLAMQVIRSGHSSFWGVLKRFHDEKLTHDSVSTYLQDAYLLEFFWLLLRYLPRYGLSPDFIAASERNSFTTDLMRVFRDNTTRFLSIGEMAAALHMAERTLTLKCRSILKISPARALMRHKIEMARTLLLQTDMPVKDISGYLGFKNPYHFSRCFKRDIGISPSSVKSLSGS